MTIDLRPDGGGGTPGQPAAESGFRLGGLRTGSTKAAADADGGPTPGGDADAAGVARHSKAPIVINDLQGLADALMGKSPPPPALAGSTLVRDAHRVQDDLDAMATLSSQGGRTLSQKLAGGDSRAAALLQHIGYDVGPDGTVRSPAGRTLSPAEVDTLGQKLLQQAAADYQQHKASYLSLRSQLEDHLDMPSRTALDDMEASMKRLEKGQKGTAGLHAVVDGFMQHIAKGRKPAAIDIGFIAKVATEGVDEASVTPEQQALIDDIVSQGGVIKRENGRIRLVGLSAGDLERIRNVHRFLTSPPSEAARQIADALVEMVQAWGRAQAVARATGLSLQQALASRKTEVGAKPPKAAAAPDTPAAGGVQPGMAIPVGRTTTTGDETKEADGSPVTASKGTAADPTALAQMAHLEQVVHDQEIQDQQYTDDKRQAALDRLTALRLNADVQAADGKATEGTQTS